MTDLPTAPLSPGDDGGGGGGRRRMLGVEQPGDEIGPYRLISPLGEGGFAVVWLAERRQPFVQRVALKLIKPGMDSKAVVARFEQERQALAVMNHPHIAKVLDGGITPAGRPYFAMELVKGEPIASYCDAERLAVEERLELFVQVCEAVQHAHMKGIIHRDLKPSNVLVSRGEGDRPVAKVIDFGVAKALTHQLSGRTVFTETGQMIGTPEYMSPEQAEPDATDIDTRSDVYSLGVILYELLVGALPFEPSELRSKAYREIQRIIREDPAPAPSTRLTGILAGDRARAESIARNRRAAEGELSRRLRSELEWIPLKAMKKSREERYGSPQELGEDVRRYLRGERLRAGPDSVAYRLRKWIARNERWFAGALIVGGAVVAYGGMLAYATAMQEDARWSLLALFVLLAVATSVAGSWVFLASLLVPMRSTTRLRDRMLAPLTLAAVPLATAALVLLIESGFSSRGDTSPAERSAFRLYILISVLALIALLIVAVLVGPYSVRRQGYSRGRGWLVLLLTVAVSIPIIYTPFWIGSRVAEIASDRSEQPTNTALDDTALEVEPWSSERLETLRRFELVEQLPDPGVVTDASARSRIAATGRPWRIRHQATGVIMLLVPEGEFLMGSPMSEVDRSPDEIQHRRRITRAFYLAENELSAAEFRSIKRGRFQQIQQGQGGMVADLSLQDALMIQLNTELTLRLPSEAEWEYACRAGTTTRYSFGDDARQGEVSIESLSSPGGKGPVPCSDLRPNAWGFRGMHGNVAEWCFDTAHEYPPEGDEQPTMSSAGSRVIRGGSFVDEARACRSAARSRADEPSRSERRKVGVRFACDADRVVIAPTPMRKGEARTP